MARSGPLPNPNRIGHSPQAEWTDVVDEPFKPGARKSLPGQREWHPLTVKWWGDLRVMPHCKLWTPGDWHAAEDLALIKDDFYQGGMAAGLVSEMRKREDLLGLTTEARHKLRIRYVSPKTKEATEPLPGTPAPQGTVTPIDQAARRRDLM